MYLPAVLISHLSVYSQSVVRQYYGTLIPSIWVPLMAAFLATPGCYVNETTYLCTFKVF